MGEHYSVDIDPGLVHEASRLLSTLTSHLETKAGRVTGTPAEIGDQWTGAAATSIKAEMTGLGGHMNGFADDLRSTKAAVDKLARDYDQAKTQVAKLNREYDAAAATYQKALHAAATEHTKAVAAATPTSGPLNRGIRGDLDSTQESAGSTAYGAQQTTIEGLDKQFAHLKQWLREQTSTAGHALSHAVPLPVPPSVVTAYRKTGTYPVRLDRTALERGMELAKEADAEVGTEVTEGEEKSLLEKLEPYRKVNEAVHAEWDVGFGDRKLGGLLKTALENAKGMPEEAAKAAETATRTSIRIKVLQALKDSGHASEENIAELADLEKSFSGLESAAADSASSATSAVRLARGLTGFSRALSVTGIAADVLTVIDPPDKGVMGDVDRGAAGVNGALLAANMMTDEIPVAGEIVMAGTGLYLAGNFLYHHVKWFHDACDSVGHATVGAAKWVGHEVSGAYHAVSHGLDVAATDVKDAGETVLHGGEHALSSGWHAVSGVFS